MIIRAKIAVPRFGARRRQQVQRVVVAERPFIAYDTSGNFLESSGAKWRGVPSAADQPNYVPVPYGNPDTTLLFQALVPSGN